MFEDLKPHLEDLRKRLVISTLTIGVAFCVCFGFWEVIFDWVAFPIQSALKNESIRAHLATLTVLEGVFVALKVAFFGSLVIAMPVIFWQFWLFVAPGLYKHEKKNSPAFCGICKHDVFLWCGVCVLCSATCCGGECLAFWKWEV